MRGERRRRLVEDQDARLDRQRLGDLDELPLGHRQAADRRVDVDLDAELLEQGLGAAGASRPSRVPSRRRRRVADEHVLRDRQVGNSAAPGARPRCRARGPGPGPWIWIGSPSSKIVPPSGWWTPARILTSVLLPAPFSPTRAWTSPATQVERDVVERLGRGELLRDPAQLGARRGARRPPAARSSSRGRRRRRP